MIVTLPAVMGVRLQLQRPGTLPISSSNRAAESLLAVGRSDEAVRLLDKALEQDPDCLAAHRLLGDFYEKQGQTAKAAKHKRRAHR